MPPTALYALAMFCRRPTLCILYTLLALTPIYAAAQRASVEQIASAYGLKTSTSLPFPSATATSTDTDALLVADWSLSKGRIQDNPGHLTFVADPFPNKPVPISTGQSSTGPVLQATYPADSYGSSDGGSGSQFYSLWNTTDGSTFQTMLLSYEVAFDEDFEWVKGGKLPGLKGGLDSTGCSGGNKSNGTDCFSTRLMWRKNGAGEVYAYIPSPNKLCSQDGIECNADFGISIQRGSFGFVSGQWNRITLLVRLNNPPNIANGNVQLYYNDLQAINQQNLQIRSASSVAANGFYFSTFFGGSDDSWATPKSVHTYYRNIVMYGGSAPSNLTGQPVKGAAGRVTSLGFGTQLLGLALGGVLAAWI
ncbi:polysaccharide lyase family 14 protein [Lyophyllum atratum]|nr:polysaccharide lyase family 14 protein [Lyophyllum atratum]